MVLGTIQSAKGTATVTYVPGYSIVVWGKADGTENTGIKLPNGTSWLVYGKATVGNHVYYQLDSNQWVDGAYVKFQSKSIIYSK